MRIKDQIKQYFENYDKPDEIEFGLFIDYAGMPTVFKSLTITTPTGDLVGDLNALVTDIGVRVVYVIEYDFTTYLFFGEEGTYGVGGITVTDANLVDLHTKGNGGFLKADLTTTTSVGYIHSGDFFPIGTPLEDIFRAMLVKAGISNLTYTTSAGPSSSILKVGTSITIDRFSWQVSSNPAGMELSDNYPGGIRALPVTGSSEIVDQTYFMDTYGSVTWILGYVSGYTSRTTTWLFETVYGVTTNIIPPTDISGGTRLLLDSRGSISIPLNTTPLQYGWIAVHSGQSKHFTHYYMSEFNQGDIVDDPGSALLYRAGTVILDGETYELLMFSNPTALTTVKLS